MDRSLFIPKIPLGSDRYPNCIWIDGTDGARALEALYRAEESCGAMPVSGFLDATGRRNDIVA